MIVTLGQKGGVVLPPEYLKQLGLKAGDKVSLTLENGGITIRGESKAIKQSPTPVRHYVPEGRNLSDELIEERREMDCE